MNLLTLNLNTFEPENYSVRKTVKAVIMNENDEVLLFGSGLIGGGVEDGESDEDALTREALEEAGIQIEIVKPLGAVTQYRDFLEKKYIITGYLCKQVGVAGDSTSTQTDEQGVRATWKNIREAVSDLKLQIDGLKNADASAYEGDTYQSKLFNRETTLRFLEEITAK